MVADKRQDTNKDKVKSETNKEFKSRGKNGRKFSRQSVSKELVYKIERIDTRCVSNMKKKEREKRPQNGTWPAQLRRSNLFPSLVSESPMSKKSTSGKSGGLNG